MAIIFNQKTQTKRLNVSDKFTKADYFYFNFEGIDPPRGIKFGVALILDFKDKDKESKELSLTTQYADSNFLLPLIRPIDLNPEEASAKLKFRTDEEVQVSVETISLSLGEEQMNLALKAISDQVSQIILRLDDLQGSGALDNSADNAPVNSKNQKNRSKSL